MTVESASYISELNASYPADADDIKEGGGPTNAPGSAPGHINMMKTVLQTQFSGLAGTTAVTASEAELNLLDGVSSLVSLGTAQEWTAQQNFNNTALTFDATQDWALTANQVATLTLDDNTTFDAPTQMVDGAFYSLIIIQDGTGSRTASWNAVFKWPGGTAPTLTTTASAKDVFVWRSDGTNMYEVGRQLNVS
jgi:hypothetical protein